MHAQGGHAHLGLVADMKPRNRPQMAMGRGAERCAAANRRPCRQRRRSGAVRGMPPPLHPRQGGNFVLASGGCGLRYIQMQLGLVDASKTLSGTFFRRARPGSEMAGQNDPNGCFGPNDRPKLPNQLGFK